MYVIKIKNKLFCSIKNQQIKNEQVEIFKTYEEALEVANLVGGEIFKIEINEIKKEENR